MDEQHSMVDELRAAATVEQREARLQLAAWHDVAKWLDYGADEFVADATTAGYLHHVGQCVREEGERRFAVPAGFDVAAV